MAQAGDGRGHEDGPKGPRSTVLTEEEEAAVVAFRGTGRMREPCRSCPHRQEDFGGCRCQAFALTGEAANTDPACALSDRHAEVFALAEAEAGAEAGRFLYRSFPGGTPEPDAG